MELGQPFSPSVVPYFALEHYWRHSSTLSKNNSECKDQLAFCYPRLPFASCYPRLPFLLPGFTISRVDTSDWGGGGLGR